MKNILCSLEHAPIENDELRSGKFHYKIDFSWAKWPAGLSGLHALNGGFDRQGNLYVATDNPDYPLTVFDPQGNYLRSFGKGLFKKAHSVYVTPQNTMLTADTAKDVNVIREITMDGRLVRDFGTYGKAGDSGYVFDVEERLLAEGKLPESDPVKKKKLIQDARLDSVVRMGTPFCRPCAMVMNGTGEYFAADGYGNDAVHCFGPDGRLRYSFGGPGREPGKFRLVHDIRVDCRGRLWVSDRENHRVQIFTQTGELITVISGNLMRIGAVWTDENYAYIGELDGGMTILDLDLHVLAQFGTKGSVMHAHGICADQDGNVYLFTNKKNPTNILRLVREK